MSLTALDRRSYYQWPGEEAWLRSESTGLPPTWSWVDCDSKPKWTEFEGSPPRSDRLFPMWPIFFDVFAHNEEQPSLDKQGVCPPRIWLILYIWQKRAVREKLCLLQVRFASNVSNSSACLEVLGRIRFTTTWHTESSWHERTLLFQLLSLLFLPVFFTNGIASPRPKNPQFTLTKG